MRTLLFQKFGVDVTAVDGVNTHVGYIWPEDFTPRGVESSPCRADAAGGGQADNSLTEFFESMKYPGWLTEDGLDLHSSGGTRK